MKGWNAAKRLVVAAGFALFASGASAVPVSLDQWYEFGFGDAGSALTNGTGTVPGVLSAQVGDPPWTFNCPALVCTLTVTDGFISVDQFEMFDNNVSLGLTSAPTPGDDCGNNELACLANPNFSHGVFLLASGAHSITGLHTLGIPGAAFFIVQVPEPSTLLLLALGLLGFGAIRRRRA